VKNILSVEKQMEEVKEENEVVNEAEIELQKCEE
jgi:hypothetical protein